MRCCQRLRDKLRTTESVLNDITQREGPLPPRDVLGGSSASSGGLDDFAPFRLSEGWIGSLPTVNPDHEGASRAGAGGVDVQGAVRHAVHAVDRWSRQASLMLKRNANVRVFGLLYVALIHVYLLYITIRLFV